MPRKSRCRAAKSDQAMWIDSHAHLEMKEFDADRDAVIDRARLAGVLQIVTVGTGLALSRKAVDLARRHENVYATVGVHPHDAAKDNRRALDELKALAKDAKVVAYGEIGLDYFHDHSPRDTQVDMFGAQLDLAAELKLPVVIHDRDAHRQTLEMVRSSLIRRGVFHCFSGDWDMAKQCIELGFYISIPGVVTFEKSKTLQDVVRQAPLDRVLLETDCPYLTPVPHRGKRNEPSYLVHTAARVAELKKISPEDVASATTQNARELFSIPAPNGVDR